MTIRGVPYGLAVMVAMMVAAGWWVIHRDPPAHFAGQPSVRVVPSRGGRAADGISDRTPDRLSASSPTGVPDMANLTVNERFDVLDRRPRDPVWSAKTEITLAGQLRDSGIVPGAIRCADTLCSVKGTVATTSPSDRKRIVDQLVRGRLHAAYDRAGVAPMQAISIDADDAGIVAVTEYVQRK